MSIHSVMFPLNCLRMKQNHHYRERRKNLKQCVTFGFFVFFNIKINNGKKRVFTSF